VHERNHTRAPKSEVAPAGANLACDLQNIASQSVMERVRLTIEGRYGQAFSFDRRFGLEDVPLSVSAEIKRACRMTRCDLQKSPDTEALLCQG
jgi:hypothetical protein